MTPEDRRAVFSHRKIAAIVKGMTQEDGTDLPITGKSLGEAILFVSEQAATDASNVHIIYGEHGSLSYTDCLSIYREYGAELRSELT
ncbi:MULTISPECIES: hypothetical protein [Rhizobium]|jgi:hypothetical protein|uniref:Uncharacterized protein n=5 Tax=Rhizobium TaxID=379 RepID=A0A4R3QTI4_9HYPH|nr:MULTISPECIES: hypothetical protein [Rhizobium]APO75268.1 hypothetical protein AM571_CH02459 [Rhizobium etli 8C-3]MBB4228931.1 hypothetical protein [Rhizobium mongolense]MBB4272837.1 hypothetical protein [Rhizobium mongolense]TCU25638.1 hypothetical protein EV130_105296 [Rhizobium azibense]TCU40075.1 hypothetical protein EV129_102212 [Rhizobium azibense]